MYKPLERRLRTEEVEAQVPSCTFTFVSRSKLPNCHCIITVTQFSDRFGE